MRLKNMMKNNSDENEDEFYWRARSLALDRLVEWLAEERDSIESLDSVRRITLVSVLLKIWELEDLELEKKSL